jgi:hypothetical protein
MKYVIHVRFLFGFEEKIKFEYPEMHGLFNEVCFAVRKRNQKLPWWNKVISARLCEEGKNGKTFFVLPERGFAKVIFNTM